MWWVASKNNRTALLCHVKLCAAFQCYLWIPVGFIVQKRPIRVKIRIRCLVRPWKIIKHPFYTKLSSVHRFVAISAFKLELQSGNAQLGEKNRRFLSLVTLKFDGWPCKTIGQSFNTTWRSMHHFIAIGESKLGLQSGNNLIWFWPLWPSPMISHLMLCMSITFVYGIISCTLHDHTMMRI